MNRRPGPVVSAVMCLGNLLLSVTGAWAQAANAPNALHRASTLRDLNNSVEALVRRVSPSVVQVLVTGLGPRDGADADSPAEIVRQTSLGSGVILDRDGYIATNAHVVAHAVRVQIVVSTESDDEPPGLRVGGAAKTFDARVVGVAREIDLALLKIDATNLRPLPIGNYDAVRKGDVVLALGSPGGLRGSVSMGVVSTVARQLDPDSPLVYIQTDASISQGSSGGPLVNVDGELIGINAFILSQPGGNQGLGFAIPSAVVAAAYPQLRARGHIEQDSIGIRVQGVTPALAAGLGLAREWGVVVADVLEGGPADSAGVRVEDLIASVDGKPTTSVPLLAMQLNARRDTSRVVLGLLRGTTQWTVEVPVVHMRTELDLSDATRLEPQAIDALGILGIEIDEQLASTLSALRVPSGVIVAARTERFGRHDLSITAGDVIHAVNGTAVSTIDGLKTALISLDPQRPIVLQVERDGALTFVTSERD